MPQFVLFPIFHVEMELESKKFELVLLGYQCKNFHNKKQYDFSDKQLKLTENCHRWISIFQFKWVKLLISIAHYEAVGQIR